MCGILGQLALRGVVDATAFAGQLAAQGHRGPDGQSVWMNPDGSIALGHNLLSLTGTTNVRQPFANEDGQIMASVNGEFYGYQRIRSDLETQGHRFRSDSDSEIVVHLYEEYGADCVSHLRGEFAFVIWDAREQRIFAARDRFGIKPLHYRLDDRNFYVASEAKAILRGSGNARWNPRALGRVFTHQYLAPDESLFAGIPQLPPAHTLSLDAGRLTIRNYWIPGNRSAELDTPSDLLSKLENAVLDRLHPDAAFSLSAGIDSSTVVALASRHLDREVPAFSVSFDEELYNELPRIASTARQLGVRVKPVQVTRQDLFEQLPHAVAMSEGLAINGQLVGKHLLARAIQKAGHRIVLSGEGADEALLGYAHLMTDHDPGQANDHPLQRGIMLPGEACRIPTSRPSWLHQWPTFLAAKFSFCQQFAPLLAPDFHQEILQDDPLAETMNRLDACGFTLPDQDSPHQGAWLWARLALVNAILKTLGDGTEMPHGLEGRVPFLDHAFFEYSWGLPTSAKLSKGRSKAIFRDAARGLLPPAISEREKHPFLAPPLLNGLRLISEIRDQIASREFGDLAFLNQPAALAWFDRVSKGSASERQSADPIIHTLLSCLALQTAYHMT